MDSWKDIATYLETSVRTVQRWEVSEGLVVHRPEHSKSGRVYAYESELDSWRTGRLEAAIPPVSHRPPVWIWAVAVFVAGSGAAWFIKSSPAVDLTPRVVHLTTVPGWKHAPSFSPDGSQVAFEWDGGSQRSADLYVQSIGTGDPRQLTTEGGRQPEWSPDGRWIAFLRPAGQNVDILLVAPTGGAERIVSRTGIGLGESGLTLAWSPDSRWLAVSDCCRGDEPAPLVRISIESGVKRQLTFARGNGPGDVSPAWSRDGRSLAFARMTDIRVSDLYVQPLSANYEPAGEPRRLTVDGQWKDQVVWTADGQQLIYVSFGNIGRTLWRLSVRPPGKPQPLPFVEAPASQPATSGQGSRLAFAHERLDSNLWRVDLSIRMTALAPAVVFADSARDEDSPAFSPTGDRVAFVSTRSGHEEVWVSRSDGSGARQLTSLENVAWPQWSSDGTSIVFNSNQGGGTQLYSVAAAGGQPRRLAVSQAHDCMAACSRDGQWVYFASNREDGYQIWKMPAAGGNAVRVTRQGGHAVKEAPDGKMLYYTKGHFAGTSLWRMPATGGQEEQVVQSVWAEGFAPAPDGVFYMTQVKPGNSFAIEFLQSGRKTPVRLKLVSDEAVRGLALSPGGKALLYASRAGPGSELMLVENFR